jgi:exonuclease SbcD
MKFLHMSDLHIGKTVNGFPMAEEQRHVFGQIIGYIRSEKPDAVLMAGDIYDRAAPGTEAVRLFDDLLTEIAECGVTLLLISGNHDSPERLNYASRLLSEQNIRICGVFDGALQSVTLRDAIGNVHFRLLPFIKPSTVRGMFGGREIESHADAVSAVLESADIDFSERNVLISHQFYTASGVAPIRSESEIDPVGGLDAIDAGVLSRFDYVALGHLHGAQNVGGRKIRYAGSPLKYSFSECRQEKSVTLVTLLEKGNLSVATLPLVPLRDMREIKGPLERLLRDDVVSRAGKDDYLRVILTDAQEIIDPMGKIRSVYPNVMALDFENPRQAALSGVAGIDAETLGALSPYELFSGFFLETHGAVMSEKQEKIVRALLEAEDGI